ncbi:C2H2-type_zinc finger domain-containing protein [Hexamita inflata]|uniref:C2H2-type zinc finger domain-containing protein n=1 Tax=Hexamita inflata TaxID=28002 RepID=A0AA86UE71_9EUKA|nr:C2H2-type zinc finger domain-containing protein [Hexamita inflata]
MSVFESSESASTTIQKSSNVSEEPFSHKFVVVMKPVPCTICNCQLKTREEQVEHYHSEAHISKLQQKYAQKCGEVWKKQENGQVDNLEVEIINVNLDESNNELSGISNIGSLEYECGCCQQRFKNQNALQAHLNTKKHKKNAEAEKGLVIEPNNNFVEETIE